MSDLIRTDATNTSDGPHMLNAIPPVRVEAGQSVQDVDITKAEYESAKHFGVFRFSHDDTPAEPGPLDQSVTKLTEYLKTVTDADQVQKLIDAETAGKSRDSALAALEARRDAILAE
ncbi:hypothetical protein [Sphingomonas sp. Leaf10]|uniref:hypothetical protein n=1 Tax=Sphingomonas sp. Leaf10 TaxID=1735676 RepID=UPI0006FE8D45|nr:hypothetical protein [Sphingomonas sp. Leaf10]KQM37947.1 hypothetical protein ASE59_11650 [Sphingomonas sp. Leaf10]